ncbi:MAG: winged helix-turn-helix transcriptional regulator [Euryarchaeota archaeon]|nr:winged helix-turn-helix transcriptional regulator [Euryarchaeota archaeon]
MKRYIVLLSLSILLIFSTTALSDDGGYVIGPPVEDGVGVDSTGADATITFWDLPLRIQVYYVSGLLMAFLGSLKIFPAVLSRIKRFLENQNRQSISEYILDNPGTTTVEISRNLGMNRGTLSHHLMVLKKQNRIIPYKTRGRIHYFLNESTYGEKEKVALAALKNDKSKRIISEILNSEQITHEKLAEKIGVSAPTISWHIRHLKEQGIVRADTDGRYTAYSIDHGYSELLHTIL